MPVLRALPVSRAAGAGLPDLLPHAVLLIERLQAEGHTDLRCAAGRTGERCLQLAHRARHAHELSPDLAHARGRCWMTSATRAFPTSRRSCTPCCAGSARVRSSSCCSSSRATRSSVMAAWSHAAFLDVLADHRLPAVDAPLLDAVGKKGPILVWNGTEAACLVRAGRAVPAKADGNCTRSSNAWSTCLPICSDHYYHRDMRAAPGRLGGAAYRGAGNSTMPYLPSVTAAQHRRRTKEIHPDTQMPARRTRRRSCRPTASAIPCHDATDGRKAPARRESPTVV